MALLFVGVCTIKLTPLDNPPPTGSKMVMVCGPAVAKDDDMVVVNLLEPLKVAGGRLALSKRTTLPEAQLVQKTSNVVAWPGLVVVG